MTRQALKIALAAALLAAPIAAHTQAPLPAPARPAVPHPPPRPQPLKNGAEMIFTNEFVVSGGYMISQNQQFIGIMQNDGRFCIYRGNSIAKPGPIVRCAPADPKPYAVYTMQMRPNGSLCINHGNGPMPGSPGEVCLPGTPRPTNEYFGVMMNSGGFELFPGHGWNPVSNVAYWTMNMVPPPRVATGPIPMPAKPPTPLPPPTPPAGGSTGTPQPTPPTPPAPLKMVPFTLAMVPPIPPKPPAAPTPMPPPPGPGGMPPPPPPPVLVPTFVTLTATVVDASGKPAAPLDPNGRPIASLPTTLTCGQQGCQGAAYPQGTLVQITSSLPLARWTGDCATGNKAPPDKSSTTCLMTVGANPAMVSGVPQQ